MASCYEPNSRQAWHDEVQSFLPHALDCVDPFCLLPLCVNLKLTLRHLQGCEKADKCTICQGMKSLAASHSNSCRDYFCRVPFCMEAKVTTQQQILMDELGKAFDAESDSQETSEELRREEASNKHSDSRGIAVKGSAMPTSVESKNGSVGDGSVKQVPLSQVSYFQRKTKIPPQNPVSVESMQPEFKERSYFKSTRHDPTERSQSSFKGELQGRSTVNKCNEPKDIPIGWLERSPSAAKIRRVTHQSQAGTKRRLQSFSFTANSTPPARITRAASATELYSRKDDGPEIEIIEITTSGQLTNQVERTATPNDAYDQQGKSNNAVFLPRRIPLRNEAKKESVKGSTMSYPKHFIKGRTSPKASSFKPLAISQVPKAPLKSRCTLSGSPRIDFRPICQDEGQVTNDSVDDYLEEMFSATFPSSPTFEMWLGETVRSNDSSATSKVVLLDTLFQLFGVVTQLKTEKQEAVFADLLKRTLRVMETEKAKL